MAALPTTRATPSAEAARELYERYRRQIFSFCLHRLGNREEAEDAVQSTFLNAFRSLQRGVAPEIEAAWLFKIAENVCLTRQRSSSRRRRLESPSDLHILADVVPARAGDSDELFGLTEALGAMPAQQRRALLLREWHGLSYAEIAAELELSQSAVETLLFRARRSLVRGLEEPQAPAPRPRRMRLRAGELGSVAAVVKTLFIGGSAKVAATVATVAATSVAVSPPVRHEVEHIVAGSARYAKAAARPETSSPATRRPSAPVKVAGAAPVAAPPRGEQASAPTPVAPPLAAPPPRVVRDPRATASERSVASRAVVPAARLALPSRSRHATETPKGTPHHPAPVMPAAFTDTRRALVPEPKRAETSPERLSEAPPLKEHEQRVGEARHSKRVEHAAARRSDDERSAGEGRTAEAAVAAPAPVAELREKRPVVGATIEAKHGSDAKKSSTASDPAPSTERTGRGRPAETSGPVVLAEVPDTKARGERAQGEKARSDNTRSETARSEKGRSENAHRENARSGNANRSADALPPADVPAAASVEQETRRYGPSEGRSGHPREQVIADAE